MTRICPECQTLNADGEKFCKNCGINLDNVSEKDTSISDEEIIENKWAQRLFYWPDKATHGYRMAKSKVIPEILFLIGFIYALIFYFVICDVAYNPIMIIIASLIIALFFSLPALAVGLLIHYFLKK